MSGLISLQLANEPGVPYSAGRFSSLTAAAVDMYSTTELVFARPAAGWRRDRPGGGGALRSGQPGPGPGRGRTPVVTAYEPHRRYAVSPTELRRNAGLVVRGRAGRRGHASDRVPRGHANRRPDRLARCRAALRRARPEPRPPPRHREPWPRSGDGRGPAPGPGSVDDHGVMVIFAGRRRGGAPLGEAFGRQVPSSPLSRSSGDQRSWRRGAR